MVELPFHQKSLHQVDVFLAGGTRAAERDAGDFCGRSHTCLRGFARLQQVIRMLFADRGQGIDIGGTGGRWPSNGEGEIKHGVRISGCGSFILLSWLHLLH